MTKLSILGTPKQCMVNETSTGIITVLHPDCQSVIKADNNGLVFYSSVAATTTQYQRMVKALQKYLNK